MSSFTTPLIVSPMPDGINWRIIKKFTYHIGSKYSRNIICVPDGFVTDFASVPRIFWIILPPWGRYGAAAVIHDYLYKNHLGKTRKQADCIFKESMKVKGVPSWQIFVMYWAVRLFAFEAWRKGINDE